VIAIAVVAYAGADVIHELGHAVVSRLSGFEILSISTVATQSSSSSRSLAAAGCIANVLTGAIAWLFLRKAQRFTATQYFLWLFGCVSLMNVGYLAFSATLDSGDWARVIAELQPALAWRAGMGIAGLLLYIVVVRQASRLMLRVVEKGLVAQGDVERLTVPAYWAGAAVMTAASLLNPIALNLVWTAGLGASLGLTCGLLGIAPIVARRAGSGRARVGEPIPLHRGWIAAGVCVAVLFVAWLGPGIQF
jgi:hypothetical protein